MPIITPFNAYPLFGASAAAPSDVCMSPQTYHLDESKLYPGYNYSSFFLTENEALITYWMSYRYKIKTTLGLTNGFYAVEGDDEGPPEPPDDIAEANELSVETEWQAFNDSIAVNRVCSAPKFFSTYHGIINPTNAGYPELFSGDASIVVSVFGEGPSSYNYVVRKAKDENENNLDFFITSGPNIHIFGVSPGAEAGITRFNTAPDSFTSSATAKFIPVKLKATTGVCFQCFLHVDNIFSETVITIDISATKARITIEPGSSANEETFFLEIELTESEVYQVATE